MVIGIFYIPSFSFFCFVLFYFVLKFSLDTGISFSIVVALVLVLDYSRCCHFPALFNRDGVAGRFFSGRLIRDI